MTKNAQYLTETGILWNLLHLQCFSAAVLTGHITALACSSV